MLKFSLHEDIFIQFVRDKSPTTFNQW